ncbi:MAG: DUF4097 family beta strand repeat protein [Archangium sp.]|nr:DUF4097 family beta strand repeat protein [Archangium sp.]
MSKMQTLPLEFGERPTLDVNVISERLRVLPVEPGGVARVEVEGRRDDIAPIRSADGSAGAVEVRKDGETIFLSAAAGGRGFWNWGASMAKRMTIYVPEHVRARIQHDFGQVWVERLAGCDLELATNAGQIDLENVRGRMKVVCDSGTVTGRGLAGTFDVVTSAGSVKLLIDSLDAGEHRIRTSMGSVKVLLAPQVKVKLEAHTTLGSARLTHPSSPDAEAHMVLSAELGSVKVKTGDDAHDPRHGDWPDWRRVWRDVAVTLADAIRSADESAGAVEDALPVARPPFVAQPQPVTPRVPEAELRKVLELVEQGKLTATDAERLIRAMGA